MKTKHTPAQWSYHTPWYVEKPYGEPGVYIAQKQSSALVCKLYTPDQIDGTERSAEEYAEFIVRAVNSFEERETELKRLKDSRDELLASIRGLIVDQEYQHISSNWTERAKAAIAKAEGK